MTSGVSAPSDMIATKLLELFEFSALVEILKSTADAAPYKFLVTYDRV